jgi:hypothetical protein
MTPPTPLEDRLRRGLHAAADALPEAPFDPPVPDGARPSRAGRSTTRRWVPRAAAVAAIALGAGALVTIADPDQGNDGSGADVSTATPGQAPARPRSPNGRVPGRAVLVNPDDPLNGTSEIRTYGPDGTATGTVDLAPVSFVQAAASDLDGGWVICGEIPWGENPPPELPGDTWEDVMEALDEARTWGDAMVATPADEVPPEATTTTTAAPTSIVTAPVPAETPEAVASDPAFSPTQTAAVWFPADSEPVVLEGGLGGIPGGCMADSMQVVDSPEGPIMLTPKLIGMEAGMKAVVLESGQIRELPLRVPLTGAVPRWSVTAGRGVITTADGGVRLVDLASGADLPVAPIDVSGASDVAISQDGASVAVLYDPSGSGLESSEVVVYDLATGAERFRETGAMGLEGAQLSYDGTTLAYGGHDGNGVDVPVTVVDLATGARHTLDAHGLLL